MDTITDKGRSFIKCWLIGTRVVSLEFLEKT